MKATSLSMLCLGLISPVVLAAPVPWLVSDGGNGHSYEAFRAPSGITWANAQADAVSRGGYLATMTSAAENSIAYGLISSDISYWYVTGSESWGPWLGGLQPSGSSEPSGGWTWVTGEAFSYANWAGLQPNNSSQNENRIQFSGHNAPGGAATWNDLNDSATTYVRAYIVEFNAVPEPSCLGLATLGLITFSLKRRKIV
jgi:Lectin C-type domain/PEP-CTERM motif